MTKLQKSLVGLVAILLITFLGCATMQDALVPCHIDQEAINYADANVPLILPYTNLNDAYYVEKRMDYVYSIGQLKYTYLKDVLGTDILASEQLKQSIFSPESPIGLLLPTLFGGTLGSLLIPRPNDKKRIKELENGNNKSN